jgi:protein-tyrosine phosphatase
VLQDLFGKPSAPTGPPRLTFVCTGNICRSPLAEKVFRERVLERDPTSAILISSGGLRAVVGAEMDTIPQAMALRYGADPSHSGVQLSRQLVDSSSIMLTMTRDQRAQLVEEFPSALKRTFTFVEFVRILKEIPDEVPSLNAASGRTLFDIALDASQHRAEIPRQPMDDIDDPYRRSEETHERVGTLIATLADELASILVPRAAY